MTWPILWVGLLLAWQNAACAGDAVVLKSYSYQTVRNGFPMPKRILRTGEIVKVLTTHGARADVVVPGGDKVSVHLIDLRMLPDAPSSATITIPQLGVATPSSPSPSPIASPSSPSPSPSPDQAGGGGAKTDGNAGARPDNETDVRTAPVRCSHLTKKGDRCTRMTTSPNGLCWQHGGNQGLSNQAAFQP